MEMEMSHAVEVNPNPTVNATGQRLARIHDILGKLTSSPWSHDALELAMAAAASIKLSNNDASPPVWLLIAGVPSSDKTRSVLAMRGAHGVHYADSLTAGALGSAFVNPKTGKQAPNLLDKFKNTCVIVKELSSLFEGRDDKVRAVLGTLTALFDGEFTKLTGTIGELKHTGFFSMVACITNHALERHHNYMSVIGSRFLIYRVPVLTDLERRHGFAIIDAAKANPAAHTAYTTELKSLVAGHLSSVQGSTVNIDPESQERAEVLRGLAELL